MARFRYWYQLLLIFLNFQCLIFSKTHFDNKIELSFFAALAWPSKMCVADRIGQELCPWFCLTS